MSTQPLIPDLHLPLLCAAGETTLESPLPLELTRISGQIRGPAASITIQQRYRNPFDQPVELEYIFPLPHEAAINGFELTIGARRITGKLDELKQAQARYSQARQEGRQAGLLEQRRPNLFAVRLANILPGEPITALLRYQEKLNYRDGEYELVIPMGLTPRYQSPQHPAEADGVDAPLAVDLSQVGPVELQLAVDAGALAGDPSSPSHSLEFERLDERRFNLRLAGRCLPDHDFVLRYSVAQEQAALAAWRATGQGGDYLLATLLPPALEYAPPTPPREFIFVLDRSGSMTGEPIAQARNALRACLRALNPEDTFRILLFDDQLEWYRAEPSPLTQEAVDQADVYLEQVNGRGGTEIIPALQAALGLPADTGRMRLVVFLTDGAVSAEERALEAVRRELGAARLFTFGIGPSVNRALLSQLARLGRGAAEFLGLDEDIEGAILRFQDRVSFPVITDLELEWQGASAWDVYPFRLPDLFAGQPLEVAARLKASGEAPARLMLSGKRQGQPVSLSLDLPAPTDDPLIARLWARLRIEDLLEQQAAGSSAMRSEVIGLALEHSLVTSYTAFVAVDSHPPVSDGKPQPVQISQPLPPGLDIEGFRGPAVAFAAMSLGAPQMMAPSPLQAPLTPAAMPPFAKSKPTGGRVRELLMRMPGLSGSVPGSPQTEAAEPEADAAELEKLVFAQEQADFDPQAALRNLARSQKLDGSWGQDLELTAAALLAFVRNGHTARLGSYRQQVRRASEWLANSAAGGFPAWLQAMALAELAQADQMKEQRKAAEAKRQALPAPQTSLERAAAAHLADPQASGPALPELNSLDDLRLAAIFAATRPPKLAPGAAWGRTALAEALMACLH